MALNRLSLDVVVGVMIKCQKSVEGDTEDFWILVDRDGFVKWSLEITYDGCICL